MKDLKKTFRSISELQDFVDEAFVRAMIAQPDDDWGTKVLSDYESFRKNLAKTVKRMAKGTAGDRAKALKRNYMTWIPRPK